MAAQTALGLLDKVAGVVHADSQRLLVGPILDGVRTQPANRRTVAVFATDAIVDGLKCLRAELRFYIQGVTVQTAIGFVGCIRETEAFGHTQVESIGKIAVTTRIVALCRPI